MNEDPTPQPSPNDNPFTGLKMPWGVCLWSLGEANKAIKEGRDPFPFMEQLRVELLKLFQAYGVDELAQEPSPQSSPESLSLYKDVIDGIIALKEEKCDNRDMRAQVLAQIQEKIIAYLDVQDKAIKLSQPLVRLWRQKAHDEENRAMALQAERDEYKTRADMSYKIIEAYMDAGDKEAFHQKLTAMEQALKPKEN
jgi:hypothetical protein